MKIENQFLERFKHSIIVGSIVMSENISGETIVVRKVEISAHDEYEPDEHDDLNAVDIDYSTYNETDDTVISTPAGYLRPSSTGSYKMEFINPTEGTPAAEALRGKKYVKISYE